MKVFKSTTYRMRIHQTLSSSMKKSQNSRYSHIMENWVLITVMKIPLMKSQQLNLREDIERKESKAKIKQHPKRKLVISHHLLTKETAPHRKQAKSISQIAPIHHKANQWNVMKVRYLKLMISNRLNELGVQWPKVRWPKLWLISWIQRLNTMGWCVLGDEMNLC